MLKLNWVKGLSICHKLVLISFSCLSHSSSIPVEETKKIISLYIIDCLWLNCRLPWIGDIRQFSYLLTNHNCHWAGHQANSKWHGRQSPNRQQAFVQIEGLSQKWSVVLQSVGVCFQNNYHPAQLSWLPRRWWSHPTAHLFNRPTLRPNYRITPYRTCPGKDRIIYCSLHQLW